MSDTDHFESESPTQASPGSGPRQQSGNILPRIASFFQALRDSESDIQRHVNEIDKVGHAIVQSSHFKANMSCSA